MKKVVAVLGTVALTLLIAATATAATVIGGGRSDTLRGTTGADVLYGKAGNDRLYGLGGNDRIYPGAGADRVSCGPGRDTVYSDGRDAIGADCEVIRGGSTTPPPPSAPLGARENPVPYRTGSELPTGWAVRVDATIPNATAIVMAENRYNDPPALGNQFFIATVTATNVRSQNVTFDYFDLYAVGASNVPYASYRQSCGVIPNSHIHEGSQAFVGGSITRNVCWEVSSAEAASLSTYYASSSGDANRIFFALR